MLNEIDVAVDKILAMDPAPIPRFVILKKFKGIMPDDPEYRSLYDKVCSHRFVKAFETAQNERGFWEPFHGYTEGVIRKLLYFGLDKEHVCLKSVSDYLVKVLKNEDDWGQYEKQDNPM